MMVLVVGLLLVCGSLLVSSVAELRQIQRTLADILAEQRALRMTSRARMQKLTLADGSEESILRRLGRESKAQRVVVGGDKDSDQYKDLARNAKGEVDLDGFS